MRRRAFRPFLVSLLSVALTCAVAYADTVKLFSPTDAYYANPYMGLVAWSEGNPTGLKQDFSLVYVDVTWAEMEPERGVFDFSALEKRCQFPLWKSLGKRAVFRLVLDEPSTKTHMDIPQWLYDMTGDGVFYSTSYGKGYCPNYSNPVLIQEHERLVKALAGWFWDDDFITFVQLGSVGHWGEWHIHPDVMKMPEIETLSVYLEHYAKAFVYGDVMLMMRRPFSIGLDVGIGLFNDSLGIAQEDQRWLGWICDGGDYEGQTGGISAMPDAWKTYAVGGEISSEVNKKKLVKNESESLIATLEASHSSWIGPNGFTDFSPVGKAQKRALASILSTIGYRLYVSRLAVVEMQEGKTKLDVTLSNAGIAPFYFGWKVKLRVQTSDGYVVLEPSVNVNDVLSESDLPFCVTVDGKVLGLEIGVFNPDDADEGILLVMDTSRDGYWQRLI
ncbi:MAG: DUF4832 domain-containing protein [Sphaerochaetaceae bacterium]|nr:DUF4832 domain-containing protein [Sphaerochaetaceae bacterium]